jgi:hypothetical protein
MGLHVHSLDVGMVGKVVRERAIMGLSVSYLPASADQAGLTAKNPRGRV